MLFHSSRLAVAVQKQHLARAARRAPPCAQHPGTKARNCGSVIRQGSVHWLGRSGACSHRPSVYAEQQVCQLILDRRLCSRWAPKALPLQFGLDISQHGGALRLDQRCTSRQPRPDLRKPELVPTHRYSLKHVTQHQWRWRRCDGREAERQYSWLGTNTLSSNYGIGYPILYAIRWDVEVVRQGCRNHHRVWAATKNRGVDVGACRCYQKGRNSEINCGCVVSSWRSTGRRGSAWWNQTGSETSFSRRLGKRLLSRCFGSGMILS